MRNKEVAKLNDETPHEDHLTNIYGLRMPVIIDEGEYANLIAGALSMRTELDGL